MSAAGPHQRQYIRILMRECDMPTDFITALHRRAFVAASVPEARHGLPVCDALQALTQLQAKAVIDALKTIKGGA